MTTRATTRRSRSRRAAPAVLIGVATLAACAGGPGDGTATSPVGLRAAATSPPTTPATDGGASTTGTDAGSPVTAARADVDRTGETIRVGLVNNEGGVISLPEFRAGAEVAIDVINEQGGVNGATIEVVRCDADGSPESSINCANTLVEEDVALAYIGIDVASDAALPVYADAGIPYITSNGWGAAQLQDPNAFILHAASSAYVVAPLVTIQEAGGESMAFVYESTAPGEARAAFVEEIAPKFGLTVEVIAVDPANPDWAAAVATAQSAGVDAVWGQLSEPGCIGLTSSAAAAGYDGLIFAGSCTLYIDVVGPAAIGTYTQADMWPASARADAPAEIQERIDEFVEAMTDAGQEAAIGFGAASYSAWRELDLILESIEGDITPDSIKEALSRGVTTPGWLGPDLECGADPWPSEPSACSASVAVFQVVETDDGVARTLVTPFENRYELTQ